MAREQLYENILLKQSFLCVGLDTDLKKVPQHLIERAAKKKNKSFKTLRHPESCYCKGLEDSESCGVL